MIYKYLGNYYFVRVDQNEEIIKTLTKILTENGIKTATISGIGALSKVLVGRYEVAQKEFISKEYSGEFEMTSLLGNLTMQNNEIKLHLHINIADKNFNTFGGHLISGVVSATAEIFILPFKNILIRNYNKNTGLYQIE